VKRMHSIRWTETTRRKSRNGELRTMNPSLLPSVATLESSDDGQLTAELRLARLLAQVAVVGALTDHIEQLARPGDADGVSGQLIEEMARLGCRLLEAAAWMTRSPQSEDSGIFPRRSAR
jgi:hypothetical protein